MALLKKQEEELKPDQNNENDSPKDKEPAEQPADPNTLIPESESPSPKEAVEEEAATQKFFWQKNKDILTVTLTTVDNPETSLVASLVKKQWENIGVKVYLNILPKEQLLLDVIQPRNYQALLFGQIVGNDPDPYAFWHSSQIKHPGVNLAMYANKKVDTLLEEARKTSDPEARAQKYVEFQNILIEDLAAIFLYNPTYPYVISKKVHDFYVKRISIPADRFNGVEKWYIKTNRNLISDDKQ